MVKDTDVDEGAVRKDRRRAKWLQHKASKRKDKRGLGGVQYCKHGYPKGGVGCVFCKYEREFGDSYGVL